MCSNNCILPFMPIQTRIIDLVAEDVEKDVFSFQDLNKGDMTKKEHYMISKLRSISNLDSSILEYSLVSKEWFQYISKECAINFNTPDFKSDCYGERLVEPEVSAVEFIHLNTPVLSRIPNNIDYCSEIEKWGVTSINFKYDLPDEYQVEHISYERLFKIGSLKFISIVRCDYVDLDELKYIVNNDRIVSFKAAIQYGGLSLENSENTSFSYSCDYCDLCQSYTHSKNIVMKNNKMSDWSEFCHLLSSNKKIKASKIYNWHNKTTVDAIEKIFKSSLTSHQTLTSIRKDDSCRILYIKRKNH
ncbi:hypothetical protein PPL_02287 [Heterostelium album PN500]|uniref:Uncharacterized protein n=1 Tax=Heterostelium pallidum (strain ATCC 26659 / Pp 5 / PN500) TaxID=670386 RepID=D3B1W2_HETP5|nr:hypothetical protein PPL_02287 [Heterostelium album PN500]EFA85286.1 hypothetical protein PPL_02287 [Heterostelium album PN500]|eukprot:XP_020437395.1 hypothetical protein PPL_02287 [Heterostelium album PN500]